MTLKVDFGEDFSHFVISRDDIGPPAQENDFWLAFVDLLRFNGIEFSSNPNTFTFAWNKFLKIAKEFEYLRNRHGVEIHYSKNASTLIGNWVNEQRQLSQLLAGEFERTPLDQPHLETLLENSGWDLSKRRPTFEQARDIWYLSQISNGAVFSVPGAGKTTVALALNCLERQKYDSLKLLVVAPKNAFPAWDEVLEDCLSGAVVGFERLVGGSEAISKILNPNPEYSIVSYSQLSNAEKVVENFMNRNNVHLILDESHRIKGGSELVTARSVLALAPYAKRREILSGTPMPNSTSDLLPQMTFLYPDSNIRQKIETMGSSGSKITPLYARTRYSELGIPRPIPIYESVEMSDEQRALYGLLRDELLNQIHVRGMDIEATRTSTLRMIQLAIDAPLAADRIIATKQLGKGPLRDICLELSSQRLSPRLQTVIAIAQKKISLGRKVVIWAPFVDTIEKLVSELAAYGAVELTGRTPSGDVDEDGTRENIVRKFHDSENCMVLVANPAAGGEGISLHRVCQTAIYAGRTYNAAHYMQSRDRICRLGLPTGVIPEITIVESLCPARLGSIDLSIRRRLDSKIEAMGRILDDPDLLEIAIESEIADQDLNDSFNFEDLNDLINELSGTLN
jgi:SNF2 family DNA or RNA helicase